MRREPNQKGVNGKPPGKDDAETNEPSTPGAEENTASDPVKPTPETGAEQEDGAPEAADEAALSSEQAASDSLPQQVQDLDLSEPVAQDIISSAEDGEGAEEEEEDDDDGDGEWISSCALLLPWSPS